jgi:D-threo-aldose 1-dehydrogenase
VKETVEWASFPIPDAMWDELKAVPFTRDNPQAARG